MKNILVVLFLNMIIAFPIEAIGKTENKPTIASEMIDKFLIKNGFLTE